VAYLWDVVSPSYVTQHRAYLDYTNEVDALVPSTVRKDEMFQLQSFGMKCFDFATYIDIPFTGRVGALQHSGSPGDASEPDVSL
jgi:hypothetical protein